MLYWKQVHTNSPNLQAFTWEFSQRVEALPGVSRVEFIGSVANGSFVPGNSDLDVFVHGHKVPRQSKKQIIGLVKEFNTKYDLGLERAACQHPTPIYVDGPLQRLLYRLLKDRVQARLLRATVKRIAPSYGSIWRLHERRLRPLHLRR